MNTIYNFSYKGEQLNLFDAVLNSQIKSITIDGVKYRFFIAEGEYLCYFKKGSSRKGRIFETELLNKNIDKVEFQKTEKDIESINWKLIDKYRKYAEKSNGLYFGEICKQLPKTYDQWVAEGSKCLYGYHITTGNKIDGKVITLSSIEKQYPYIVESFKNALKYKTKYNSSTVNFRGYDMTVNIYPDENGTIRGYLNMEFKGMGNGYYYMLINNDSFIGVDVD